VRTVRAWERRRRRRWHEGGLGLWRRGRGCETWTANADGGAGYGRRLRGRPEWKADAWGRQRITHQVIVLHSFFLREIFIFLNSTT
jgi:hypothetical protein